ncbi:NAD(P)-dependent oxidoreductase [Pseudoalteromonas luteoviolacea]|uniref:Oxidoreductase n=1 Tax=Pseudoalteromonas luteoviolacea S4054 TaxID=1129367 RepID=A0A0F6AG23_9GAMM|nr:NAD(P)-dependent oxidoreductase [Pseudoalteromonas luteoviolacea]AOT08427.1 oxidoreductase [Pseudoalteromonas luteoviolacea]AOT13343.1 oxidoreductase [Pseudoalteromonas luteoviolacea]AOT18256.1 oxidoreductase [Pseudoalteromonas luteoviolacea]KKE84756.1 oxidoreductase [Pseudoalteromonas luteoviolacea S4054]KZN76015.1 oxidoreductase [Pseudoalteromonas luteoviolacea S4047-1]
MTSNKKNVAFVGLGVMGFPMAGHLANQGYNVTVYNRTTSKAQAWLDTYSGQLATTPALAAINADIVFVCVGNDDDLREVTSGADGVLKSMKDNTILVDHTTASADVARELFAACKAQNIGFIDAPVSGGEAGAVNGQLTIMCGGNTETYEQVEPVMAAYARFSKLLGEVGSGQIAKMMNQICIAGVVQGLAEALQFGQNANIDCEAVVEVISKGAAGSWQMENRHKSMLDDHYEHGFAVDWMRKDLAIALDEAKKNGSTLPLTALVDQFYADVQKMGGNRWDTSSLLKRLV